MIEQLFGSKTRVKLLQLFYQNPNRSYYVREITRKIDEQINSVRRELANLLNVGIIKSDTNNNRLYYEVDQSFKHYQALSSIFTNKKYKPVGKTSVRTDKKQEVIEEVTANNDEAVQQQNDPFVDNLLKTGNVNLLLYSGQFTRDDSAGIDILIVGDVNHASIEHLISELEKAEKKIIKYSIFSPSEYVYRKQINDRFVSNIAAAKKIIFVNKDNIL